MCQIQWNRAHIVMMSFYLNGFSHHWYYVKIIFKIPCDADDEFLYVTVYHYSFLSSFLRRTFNFSISSLPTLYSCPYGHKS